MSCSVCDQLVAVWQETVHAYSDSVRNIRGAVGSDLSKALDLTERLRKACFKASDDMTTHMRTHHHSGENRGVALGPVTD